MKGSVGKWYKKGFDRLKVIAPASVWTNVSAELKNWPAGWYSANTEKIDISPKKDSWETIANAVQPLNAHNRSLRFFIYRAGSVAVIFAMLPFGFNDSSKTSIIGLPFGLNLFSQFTESYTQDIIQSEVVPEQQVAQHDANSSSVSLISENYPLNVPNRTFSRANDDKERSEFTLMSTRIPLKKIEPGYPHRMIIVDVVNGLSFGRDELSKFALGVKINAHGSTLLTPQTRLALNSESSVQSHLGVNVSFGVTGRYAFNNKNAISFDFMVDDRKTQIIENYSAGSLVERRTDLTYTSLSASYQRNVFNPQHVRKNAHALYVGIGVFGSYRTSLLELLNQEVVNNYEEGYRKFDMGTDFGVDYSVNLTNRIEWSAGLKYQLGLMNVFKGVDKVPASFLNTYTSSFGLTSSFKYRF
tara:strand:- start:522 stop:1763 length:1242 start_codon:yes stop_codon:yes gene_type:complete